MVFDPELTSHRAFFGGPIRAAEIVSARRSPKVRLPIGCSYKLNQNGLKSVWARFPKLKRPRPDGKAGSLRPLL